MKYGSPSASQPAPFPSRNAEERDQRIVVGDLESSNSTGKRGGYE
jgi:hypothetical protein